MRWLRISVFLFATVLLSAYIDNVLGSSASEAHAKALTETLSPGAKVYFPNSTEFNTLTTRWSSLAEPVINVAVVPAIEDDVVKIVSSTLSVLCLM